MRIAHVTQWYLPGVGYQENCLPFQQLQLESGPHRIEVRADGYEPLSFEVRILPGRTITYKADLKKLP